jgi:hypothetical protein
MENQDHDALTEVSSDNSNAASERPLMTQVFVEALDITEGMLDKATRSVRQVLIRAGESKNRRFYPEDVLQASVKLFEGVKTYADHPTRADMSQRPERSVRELTGWIADVVFENGALKGTRYFLPTQAGNDSWAVVEAIIEGKAPASLMGASINAVGKAKAGKSNTGDIVFVESIERVVSVDDVTAPAAGGGWERLVAGGDEMQTALIQALGYDEYLQARPDYVQRLKNEHKMVRLGDATKTAMAEADQRVKAANRQLAEKDEALEVANGHVFGLTEVNARLVSEVETLKRTIAVTEALKYVKLPQPYKDDLEKRLPGLLESEWEKVIMTEVNKAKTAGAIARVPVSNAPQQVQAQPSMNRANNRAPLPDEDVAAWQRRVNRMDNNKG